MKKIISILSCALLTSSVQVKAQSNISIGPVGSIGVSRITNASPSADFRLSGAVGAGMVYSTFSRWGFGVQVLASREGFGNTDSIPNGIVKYSYRPLYLRIPLTAQYFFGKYGNRIRPKLYAGPSVGIKIAEKTKYTANVNDVESKSSSKTNLFKTLDLGLQAGGGANVRIAPRTWLNLDVAYYQGILNVINSSPNTTYLNQNIRFNAGVLFGI